MHLHGPLPPISERTRRRHVVVGAAVVVRVVDAAHLVARVPAGDADEAPQEEGADVAEEEEGEEEVAEDVAVPVGACFTGSSCRTADLSTPAGRSR